MGTDSVRVQLHLQIIAIVWIYHWVVGWTVLGRHIHDFDLSNYCDYNSKDSSHNHNVWLNHRCDWTPYVKFAIAAINNA